MQRLSRYRITDCQQCVQSPLAVICGAQRERSSRKLKGLHFSTMIVQESTVALLMTAAVGESEQWIYRAIAMPS